MDKKWYPCEQCGKLLSSYKCYWRHKKLLHRNSEKTGGGFDDLYQSRVFDKQTLQPLGNECQQSSVKKVQYGNDTYSTDRSRDIATYSWYVNGFPPPSPPPTSASVDRCSSDIVKSMDGEPDFATYAPKKIEKCRSQSLRSHQEWIRT